MSCINLKDEFTQASSQIGRQYYDPQSMGKKLRIILFIIISYYYYIYIYSYFYEIYFCKYGRYDDKSIYNVSMHHLRAKQLTKLHGYSSKISHNTIYSFL